MRMWGPRSLCYRVSLSCCPSLKSLVFPCHSSCLCRLPCLSIYCTVSMLSRPEFFGGTHLLSHKCSYVSHLWRYGICPDGKIVPIQRKLYLRTSGKFISTRLGPSFPWYSCNSWKSFFCEPQYSVSILTGDSSMMFFLYLATRWRDIFSFVFYINSVHLTIKFTVNYSPTDNDVLDIKVKIPPDDTLSTDLRTEPTDTHQFLPATPCHSGHIKRSIAYSQALRILCICSDCCMSVCWPI